MTLAQYFQDRAGTGVLSTSNANGDVDAAIYARPHFLADDDQTLSMIMADHRSHQYLQSNSNACYLFIEDGPGYRGKRLYLTKIGEEQDAEKIEAIRRRCTPDVCAGEEGARRFLVHFAVTSERPLVGDAAQPTCECSK